VADALRHRALAIAGRLTVRIIVVRLRAAANIIKCARRRPQHDLIEGAFAQNSGVTV
jgi:hypothetical protein